ncbi:polysaccharide deacetylase family protein [Nonomuraea typhae]|uniref:polysaccharide deacetylase family protein n=1 Tax=Nonomuraea typhae TaxID=2603600 RepID=UPI001C66CDE1|nr:polysaccharide deacetylase family protein [Nonomuraea typhae]
MVVYTGIAWTGDGYEISVIDRSGTRKMPDQRFGAADLLVLFEYIFALQSPTVVVDSSNGMLDGTMLAAGLTVYRADPWTLGAAPEFGSVSAFSLAETARANLPKLVRLELASGSLTGRLAEVEKGILEARITERELTEAGHCISHGRRDLRRIALTFDDGPHPLYTGQVLDTLQRYGIPATFFCVGLHASGLPGLVTRIGEAGHELGNHTWSHAFLPDLSRRQLATQVERTAECLTGRGARSWFRPPYGSRSSVILSWLVGLKLTTVLWDVEPFDWAMPGAGVIAARVLADTRPGSILLLHDGGGDRSQTVAALPQIIEGLLSQDYEFVTVSSLTTA